MEETEIDAQIRQHRPGDERSGRENDLVIGGKHRRQKDREQAGQAQHRAIKQLAIAGFDFVVNRLPQIDARKAFRRQFGDVGNGLSRLKRDAEHIGLIALDALGHEAH